MDNQATHLSDDEIARYCEGNMPPLALLAADDHLALCEVCYGRMSKAQGPDEQLLAAGKAFDKSFEGAADEVTHLTYEQMAALVDSKVDDIDREIVDSHLELCRRCEAELNDLRELSTAMAPRLVVPLRAPSLRERFISLWSLSAFRIPAQATAALVILVLAALLMNILLRGDNSVSPGSVAEKKQGDGEMTPREAPASEDVQSDIAVKREEKDPSRQAAESRAAASIALNDGDGQVTLDSQGNLSGVRADSGDERAVKNALRSGRVMLPPSLRELRGQSGTLMGDAGAGFSLVAPVGIVIQSNRPVLSWSALDGATSYAVTVFDSNLSQVAASDRLTMNQWTLPSPLARGRTYIWQVRAVTDGGEVIAPPAAASRVKFKVLEQTKVETIERAKRSKSHLVLGVVYAQAGLLDDAEREFAALVTANPQSQTARRLLKSVRSARR